jgi:hypothetical protein
LPETLEGLLSAALKEASSRAPRRVAAVPAASLFDDSHWRPARVVALVHNETATLLGAFEEFKHSTLVDCRKLTRLAAPRPIDATEYVSGDQWIRRPSHRIKLEIRFTQADCILPSLGLRALNVDLECSLASDGLHRARLVYTTSFVDAGLDKALFLPERMDILDCLSRDCKLALRASVGL